MIRFLRSTILPSSSRSRLVHSCLGFPRASPPLTTSSLGSFCMRRPVCVSLIYIRTTASGP